MSRRVGVDLSSTRAALASVRETRRSLQLHGFALVEGDGPVDVIASDLREARRTYRFPRAAEVVAWAGDPRIDAVTGAGFKVERVITPGEALARVARLHFRGHPASGVAAVLSLHLTSGAVAIVKDGHLLFETQLGWGGAATLSGADSELLRRYTFVSELTESLRRVFETVRTRQGLEVTEILTCGSLTDLRSLTMPLAAEFDVEVETLDLTDDIEIRVRDASPQQMRDTIASLRLAIAAGKRWHKRTFKDVVPRVRVPHLSLATRAALLSAAGVLLVFLWVRFERPAPSTRLATSTRTRAATPSNRPPGPVTLPAPVSPARVAPSKPALAARPLRVNARLQPVPQGIQHAALLLALAKAEQAIAPPPVAPQPPAAVARQQAPPAAVARQQTAPAPVARQQTSAPPVARQQTPVPPVARQQTPPAPVARQQTPAPSVARQNMPPAPAAQAARVAATPRGAAPPSIAPPQPRSAATTPASAAQPIVPNASSRIATAASGAAPLPPAKSSPTSPTPTRPMETRRTARAESPTSTPKPIVTAPRIPPSPSTSPTAVASSTIAPPRSPAAPAWSPTTAVEKASPYQREQPITSTASSAAADATAPLAAAKPARSFLPPPADVVVSSILWSSDRQLAIVNSRIVGAGDIVGRHTVVEIEADGVVFRDRAGRLHRAGLRQGP